MSWVELARAGALPEMMLLRARLEAAGIPVRVEGEGAHGVLPVGIMTMRVLVPEEHLEAARALAARWREDEGLAADD